MLSGRFNGFERFAGERVAEGDGEQAVGMAVAGRNHALNFRLTGRRVARNLGGYNLAFSIYVVLFTPDEHIVVYFFPILYLF